MLYKPSLIESEDIDFLFDAEIYNEDIDIREVAAIEGFYSKHGYIPEKHINTFLNWLIYSARRNVCSQLEDVTKSSFSGRCATAQSFFCAILQKMGFDRFSFNIGGVLGTESIHALTCVSIPTKHNGEDISKLFVLDPTFRQFCIKEENRFERYFEEPRWSVKMSTPHPGYFFNLTDEGKKFAKNLIHYGYFEINEENLKKYFDPFSLYITPKEAYENPEQIGLLSSTDVTGMDYWNNILNAKTEPLNFYRNFDLNTPREVVLHEDNKLFNRLRRKNTQKELDTMFEEDNLQTGFNENKKSTK